MDLNTGVGGLVGGSVGGPEVVVVNCIRRRMISALERGISSMDWTSKMEPSSNVTMVGSSLFTLAVTICSTVSIS